MAALPTTVSTNTANIATNTSNINGHLADPNPHGSLQWKGEWTQADHVINDTVRDGAWLMVANKSTDTRPAPQENGDPFNLHEGTLASQSPTVKQVIIGQSYTFTEGAWIKGYKIDVVAGNHYRIFSIKDPSGSAELNEVISFTADSSGTKVFGVDSLIVPSGTEFYFGAIINEPDPAPTTFNGDWFYIIPNNTQVPLDGQIVHANKAIDELWISKSDDLLVDRSAELATLTIGDIISTPFTDWAIQSISDEGDYIKFGVSPALQGSQGIHTFTFESVSATPITYGRDDNYWSGSPYVGSVEGIYSETGIDNLVTNDHAYAIDIEVQRATISPDWDLLAYSNIGGGGAENLQSQAVENDYYARHGWAFYGDSAYTSGSPLTINNARVKVTIDGLHASTDKASLPAETTDLWDSSTNKIIPCGLNDCYDIRLQFKATDGAGLALYDVELDIGGGIGIILERTKRVDKGAGVTVREFLASGLFVKSTFLANGGEFYIDTTDTGDSVDIWDISLFIRRSFRGK